MENKKTTKAVKKVAKTAAKKTTRNTPKKETKRQKKKGFTLIELLAVIIILGILMIIAIPSVTSYINDSRKNAYVDTAKEIVSGTRNIVNEGSLGMYDTDTTFYIPAKYVNTENSLKSPYGEFTETSAYVGVIYDGKGYKYYWISSDDTGQGIPVVTPLEKIDTDSIKSDLNPNDILTTIEKTGIGNRSKIKILNMDGTWRPIQLSDTSNNIPEEGGNNSPTISIATCVIEGCTKTEVGTELTIGGDNFYVVSSNEIETVLLAKYDLKTNVDPPIQVTSGATSMKYQKTSNVYWKNNIGDNLDYPASSTLGNYIFAYACDEKCNMYEPVNSYATSISSRVGVMVSGRLLTNEEANSLSNSLRKDNNGKSYYLGTVRNDGQVILIMSNGNKGISNALYVNSYCRPVIIISTSNL